MDAGEGDLCSAKCRQTALFF